MIFFFQGFFFFFFQKFCFWFELYIQNKISSLFREPLQASFKQKSLPKQNEDTNPETPDRQNFSKTHTRNHSSQRLDFSSNFDFILFFYFLKKTKPLKFKVNQWVEVEVDLV